MSKDTIMGLVLWIDENTFATSLIQKVFKKRGLSFYTLSEVHDFSYLIEDLSPSLIVLDAKTASNNLSTFKAQFDSSLKLQKLPFVLIDDTNELGFIKNIAGQIKRPFDPFNIPELLLKITESH